MADIKSAGTHPAWEDWLGLGLGILVVLTPALSGDAVSKTVHLNTVFIGLLILLAAFQERLQLLERAEERSREWEELAEGALGGLLIASPFIFGYAAEGTLRFWHFALGGIVLLLAVYELWRDWTGDVARRRAEGRE